MAVKIILFDFDGTLSSGDANFGFYYYTFRRSWRPALFLPLIAAGAIAKLFNPYGIWPRETMRRYLTANMVKKFAPGFIAEHKRNRFGWAADKTAEEKSSGAIVICISASPNYLLKPLVADLGFDFVICSEMEKARPWKYAKPCWNKYKVARLAEWMMEEEIEKTDVVRAYSDSKSDLPMMDLAKEQVWINPRTGTRSCRRRG